MIRKEARKTRRAKPRSFAGRLRKAKEEGRLTLFAGPAPARHAPEIDMAICVPNIEVETKPGRCTAQTHLYAANVFAWLQLQITNIRCFDAANEVVILLLLLSNRPR